MDKRTILCSVRINNFLFIGLMLLFLASCGKVDFGCLEINQPYVGLYNGNDCVVVFDQMVEGNIKGRAYLDMGEPTVAPINFSSDVGRNGKGFVWIDNNQMAVKLSLKDGTIRGELHSVERSISFSLQKQPEESYSFKAMYKEPLYEVNVEQDRTYAFDVQGYWSSYLDSQEDFGTIYAKKVSHLAVVKDLDLDMDVYYPRDPSTQRRPLLLLIHGGAFYNGDKTSIGYPEMGNYFAERGYVVASINYRLGFWPLSQSVDRAGYRAVQDANAAVRYLVENAEEFHIDTANIFVAGTSAGGITALNLAFMQEENRPDASRKVTGRLLRDFAKDILKIGEAIVRKGSQLIENAFNWFGVDTGKSVVMQRLKNADFDDLSKRLGLDYDLGAIESVNPDCQHSFKIKAVVNMWGAIHDLSMLRNANARSTAILSFHGDADRIVPYDYDYPFREVLDPYVYDVVDELPQWMADIVMSWLLGQRPINELAFRKMYGSKAIHDKATSLGMHCELHTCPGGGHSLHVNDDGSLSDYFHETILPNMTRFLCEELVDGDMVKLNRREPNGQWFEAVGYDNVVELHWQVEGGAVVGKTEGKNVKVLLFGDAPSHKVTVCGKYKNGIEFNEVLFVK